MNRVDYPYAGLILPDTQDLDPTPYLDTAAAVLARLDRDGGQGVTRGSHAVFGATLGVQVISEEDSDYGPRVLIEIITRDGELPGEDMDDAASALLSETVLRCLDHSSADILEWYAPDVLLDRDDFIRLRSYVSPRRARLSKPATEDATVTQDLLSDYEANDHVAQGIRGRLFAQSNTRDDDDRPKVTDRLSQYKITMAATAPEERRISSAGWLLTGALAIFSWPVAIFVAIMNGGRGADLRLVSQALAVTGLFTVLYHTDRLTDFIRMLLH